MTRYRVNWRSSPLLSICGRCKMQQFVFYFVKTIPTCPEPLDAWKLHWSNRSLNFSVWRISLPLECKCLNRTSCTPATVCPSYPINMMWLIECTCVPVSNSHGLYYNRGQQRWHSLKKKMNIIHPMWMQIVSDPVFKLKWKRMLSPKQG